MQGAPHRQARSSARSFFLLPSVLALLALALFPVSAFAGNAGETVYETEIPSVTSEPSTGGNNSGKSPTHHSSHNTGNGETGRATGSNAEVGGGTEGSEGKSGDHKKKGSSSQEEEGQSSTVGGGGGNKPNGGGGGGQSESGVSGNQPVAHTTSGANVSHSSGGSSPVVPILIAVAVLAAISIGVVLYRQRKSGQDGSDGRVSSSNAS
jgi:cobalamin biosynthesis Mg chelatase CobN